MTRNYWKLEKLYWERIIPQVVNLVSPRFPSKNVLADTPTNFSRLPNVKSCRRRLTSIFSYVFRCMTLPSCHHQVYLSTCQSDSDIIIKINTQQGYYRPTFSRSFDDSINLRNDYQQKSRHECSIRKLLLWEQSMIISLGLVSEPKMTLNFLIMACLLSLR